MVAPLVAGAVGLSAMLGGMYEGLSAYENRRYWDNYRASTGRSPAYPFRSGYSNIGRYSSIAGRFAVAGYFTSPTPSFHPMNRSSRSRGGPVWGHDIRYIY